MEASKIKIGDTLLRNKIYERDNHKCVKCGSGENLTIDHIVPILKGGISIESNIQTLCFKCNQQKGCSTTK